MKVPYNVENSRLGSLSFGGIAYWKIELACSVRHTFFESYDQDLYFWVHNFFKNFTYAGTCLIVSRRRRLIWTCLNNFNILSSFFSFLSVGIGAFRVLENGALGK